jgi:hypothetical protein
MLKYCARKEEAVAKREGWDGVTIEGMAGLTITPTNNTTSIP